MRRWIFAVMIALCAVACEKKVETKEEIQNKNSETTGVLQHVTCFSGGQVVYEGDLRYYTGETWYYVDVKTQLKFNFKDQNDCYWTSAPFYKVKD